MVEVWYAIVALLVTGYAVLDGFDLGAGAIHHVVARSDRERREVFAAIGPYWDGNEVFLIATGGALFLAFPRALSALLSGLYLAVFIFLWLLLLRGIAIEFRSHLGDGLWRAFWDRVFALASGGLAVMFGAAVANVIRGVPLDEEGHFSLPLFSSFSPLGEPGLLDWYTVAGGLFALLALATHGAAFLAWKTGGEVHARSLRAARRLGVALLPGWVFISVLTLAIRPDLWDGIAGRPVAWLAALASTIGLASGLRALVLGRPGAAFAGTSAFLAGLGLATAALSYPVLLFARTNPAASLLAPAVASAGVGLATGLAWWCLAAVIAAAYFVLVFRLHRGKVAVDEE